MENNSETTNKTQIATNESLSDLSGLLAGDRIWFDEEKRPYTIKAANKRFKVCTKPYNIKHTVIYTIVDLDRQIRGTENLVFCMGFENIKLCKEALKRLENGESEVSSRNYIPLKISKTERSSS